MTVTYEQAVRLKELGFDNLTDCYYGIQSKELWSSDLQENFNFQKRGVLSAPTVAEALQWLRDEKKIPCAVILYCEEDREVFYVGEFLKVGANLSEDTKTFDTFPEAETALLDAVLKHLES